MIKILCNSNYFIKELVEKVFSALYVFNFFFIFSVQPNNFKYFT